MTKQGKNAPPEKLQQGDEGFKVTDKRAFTADGELRDEDLKFAHATESAPEPISNPANEEPKVSEATVPQDTKDVGFADLVSLLASQALLALGDLPNPAGDESKEDLASAQIMISFLEVLRTRTKANLTADEAQNLDGVLYNLRMRYMQKANLIKY